MTSTVTDCEVCSSATNPRTHLICYDPEGSRFYYLHPKCRHTLDADERRAFLVHFGLGLRSINPFNAPEYAQRLSSGKLGELNAAVLELDAAIFKLKRYVHAIKELPKNPSFLNDLNSEDLLTPFLAIHGQSLDSYATTILVRDILERLDDD